MRQHHLTALVWLTLLCALLLPATLLADDGANTPVIPAHPTFANLQVPHLDHAPTISDFISMEPSPPFAATMLKIDKFTQRDPHDGAPISQRTELYLGYTNTDLYVVCICFDDQRRGIRARMGRRELIDDDDQFGMVLDTFHDHKHAVFFFLNPMGVQQDGIWLEDQDPDYSYDMVWRSDAKLTDKGYVVLFEIPFRSIRFPRSPEQTWGVFFERDIRRNNEYAFYPPITSNAQGFLGQETAMTGLREISPGRNLQFNPYASFRTFRSLDDRDVNNAHFDGKHIEPRLGLDSKVVIKDALVLDATINPDFSQVESDEPQITANQRFEVYFPEKRPFFLENSSYFATPINLVFTRRIADPEYGIRLTGKLGGWSLATLFADDRSPGRSVPPYDPLSGSKAYYSILRVNRDIGRESSIGFIYTDREMHATPTTICDDDPCLVSKNRIGGIDTKLKLNSKWMLQAQALASSTTFNDGTRQAGPAYSVYAERSSRKLEYNILYLDYSPGFETLPGYVQRTDIRRVSQLVQYRFRREGKFLQWHGPSLYTINNWDHSGTRLEWYANSNYRWVFSRQTNVGFYGNLGHERLRPIDYDTLTANRDYSHYHTGTFFNFGYFTPLMVRAEMDFGRETNYDTAIGPPVLARSNYADIQATVRPVNGLTVDNTYLFTRLRDMITGQAIFNNHILRSKWNYQFTRALSLRFIGQYGAVLSNPAYSSLVPAKNFNADVLVTYLVHPGTAVYVGYNSNLQNLDPSLVADPNGNLLHTPNHFLNDGRQLFVKLSYLFRY